MLFLRQYSHVGRSFVTRRLILLTLGVFSPLLIILYFMAGSNCVQPQPHGVHVITGNICCGQGFVFPQSAIDPLLEAFERVRWESVPTDTFIEDYGDLTGGLRWALTPVVMQHVGGQSSYGEPGISVMTPSDMWNFAFEQNNAEALASEHEANDRRNFN